MGNLGLDTREYSVFARACLAPNGALTRLFDAQQAYPGLTMFKDAIQSVRRPATVPGRNPYRKPRRKPVRWQDKR